MLKIDVEGFETAVIGGRGLLAAGRIVFVYAEVIAQALREAGSSAEQLRSFDLQQNLCSSAFAHSLSRCSSRAALRKL